MITLRMPKVDGDGNHPDITPTHPGQQLGENTLCQPPGELSAELFVRPDSLTVLRTIDGHVAAKTIRATTAGIEIENFDAGAKFVPETVSVDGIHSLADVLTGLAADPTRLVIRGRLGPNRKPAKSDGAVFRRKTVPGSTWRGYFEPAARRWVCIDIDEPLLMAGMSQAEDPEAVVRHALALLGRPWRDVTVYWQGSSKAGLPGILKIKLHLWFWFDEPVDDSQLRAKFRLMNKRDGLKVVDEALADSIQIHYTAAPVFVGMVDPLQRRQGVLSGSVDEVAVADLHLAPLPMAKAKPGRAKVVLPSPMRAGVVSKTALPPSPSKEEAVASPDRVSSAVIFHQRPRAGLYAAILDDILVLARHRHGGGGVGDGERDCFLFAATIAAVNVRPGRMEAAASELATILVPDKPEIWVASKLSALADRTARHVAGERLLQGGKVVSPIYSPTVAWFVNFLSITDEEMAGLSKLVSGAVSRRRRRGLTPAAQLKAECRERTHSLALAAAELYCRRNLNAPAVARQLGVGERRVWALLDVVFAEAEALAGY